MYFYIYLSQECLKVCWALGGRETAKRACVSFSSYFLASSLGSLGSQKPKCICILNSPYHHRTDTLICFSATDYRNQVLGVLVFFSPSSGGALKHFTCEHWKSEKRTSISIPAFFHCHHSSRGKADPQVSVMIRG